MAAPPPPHAAGAFALPVTEMAEALSLLVATERGIPATELARDRAVLERAAREEQATADAFALLAGDAAVEVATTTTEVTRVRAERKYRKSRERITHVPKEERQRAAREEQATADAFALLAGDAAAVEVATTTAVTRVRAERKYREHLERILRMAEVPKEERQRAAREANESTYVSKRSLARFQRSLSPRDRRFLSPYAPGRKYYDDDGKEITGEEKREIQRMMSLSMQTYAEWGDRCRAESNARADNEYKRQERKRQNREAAMRHRAAMTPKEIAEEADAINRILSRPLPPLPPRTSMQSIPSTTTVGGLRGYPSSWFHSGLLESESAAAAAPSRSPIRIADSGGGAIQSCMADWSSLSGGFESEPQWYRMGLIQSCMADWSSLSGGFESEPQRRAEQPLDTAQESISGLIARTTPLDFRWTWRMREAKAAAAAAAVPPSEVDVDTAKKMVRLTNLYRAFACAASNAAQKIDSPYDAVAYGHPALQSVERVEWAIKHFIRVEFPTFCDHYDDTTQPFPDINEISLWPGRVLYLIKEAPYVGEQGASKSCHELAERIRAMIREHVVIAKTTLGKYWRVCAEHARDKVELKELLTLERQTLDHFDWDKIKMF